MCTQSECQHELELQNSKVRGEYRIRYWKCVKPGCKGGPNGKAFRWKQVIPEAHAPRRRFSTPRRTLGEAVMIETGTPRLPSGDARTSSR